MPFIVPIIGAIAGAIGSIGTFLGGLGALGKMLIGIGLNVASALVQKALAKKQKAPPGGVQFERQYGADVPRHVACGLVGMAGHDCYINTYGSSNKYLQQIYTISDYPCDGLSRVAINGKWATLGAEDPEKGRVVTSGDFAGLIWFKFIDGRQTAADPYLVDNANPASRWTDDHIGIGEAGILVSMTYDQEKNNQFPDFFFEFRGARLYDWRRDSSVGGSGPHRWNDPSTHEFSENPIVIEYNYRRGFSINGDVFCGMGMPASDLPLYKWTTAANICDENAGGEPRYRCSILLDCMSTHGSNIESIALSCGAMTVDGVEGSWPIVGSDQPVVMTFTDDDLITTAPVRYRAKRSQSELVNSVSGNFPDPDNLWSMVGYEPQISAVHVALDRRTRDLPIDFPQVRSGRQAAQLASIYLYENRYEATGTVVLRPRFQVLEPGDWVRWNSKRYGDKIYIVTETQLMSLDSEGPRNIQLSLQERDGAIYDSVSPPPIIVPTPPGTPAYLNEVQDFALVPVSISGADGRLASAIRASWSAIADETVTAVEVHYYPTEQPDAVIIKTVQVPTTVTLLAEGIVDGTEYTVRTKLVTDPARVTVLSAGKTVVTDVIPIWPGLIAEIDQHVTEMLDWTNSDSPIFDLGQEVSANTDAIVAERSERMLDVGGLADRWRSLYETVNRTAFALSDTMLAQKRDLVVVREELVSVDQTGRAFALDQIQLAVGPGSALAERLTTIEGQAAANYVALSGAIHTVQSVALDAVADEATARQALRIQLVGNYTGNDIEQVTSGLLYQDRQGWISETQALSTAIDLVAAGIGSASLFDWIKEWSWESTLLGWTGNGTPTVANGWLRPANHATDPYIVSPVALGVNGSLYKQVRLYIRRVGSPMWDGYLWWQADSDTTWDAARRVAISEPTYIDGQAAVTVNAEWIGTLNRIRIDLSAAQTANDYFEVSYVYIGRPSPGASQAQVSAVQQALASQIFAEATSREALSVALTGLADPTGATLPSLSEGLIYDERIARVSGDQANTQLIQGVAAQIEDPETGLDALAQVQSTMQGQISSLAGTVTVMGQSIDDLVLSVDDLETGKADVGITDGLQAQIDQMGGGEGLSLIAEAVRSMRLTVDRLALGQAGVWLAGRQDRNELGDIVADVHQQATSRIDITDQRVDLHGRILDQINLDLGGKADLSLVSALDGRVTATEGQIVNIGQSILSIQGSIGALETGKADASVLVNYRTILDSYSRSETDTVATTAATSATTALSSSLTPQITAAQGAADAAQGTANTAANAVSALGTRVTDTEDGLQSLSEALIGVDARVDGVSAEGKFRVGATATEAGALSTLALSVAATAEGATQQAAMLMSARSDGKSMIGFLADLIYFKDPAGRFDPFVIESGAAYFNNARIKDLTADSIKAKSLDANAVLQNGTLVTDLMAFSANTTTGLLELPEISVNDNGDGVWTELGRVTFDNENPNPPIVNFDFSAQATSAGSNTQLTRHILTVRLRNSISNRILGSVTAEAVKSSAGTVVDEKATGSVCYVDFDIQQGSSAYILEYSAYRLGGSASGGAKVLSARIALLCAKR